MAFDVFSQLQGPQIDIDLFSKSTTAGINAGNASPTAVTAGIQGALKGVQQGQQIYENYQDAQIKQNQIEQLPVQNEMDQAQLENQKAIASINQNKARLDAATQALQLQKEAAVLQAQATSAETQLQDVNAIKKVQEQLSVNPTQALADIRNPAVAGTLMRNPDAAAQIFAGLNSSGIPKEQYKDIAAAVDGAARRKLALEEAARLQVAQAAAKEKNKTNYENATLALAPELSKAQAVGDGTVDPEKLSIRSNSRINREKLGLGGKVGIRSAAEATKEEGFSLIYDGKIVGEYDTQAQAEKAQRNLDLYKSFNAATPTAKVQETKKEEVKPTAAPAVLTSAPAPTPSSNKSDAIAAKVKERFDGARASAAAKGADAEFQDLSNRGKTFVAPVPTQKLVDESQATPVPPTQPAVTRKLNSDQQAKLDSMFEGTIGGLGDPNQPTNKIRKALVSNDGTIPNPELNARVTELIGSPTKVNLSSNPKTYAAQIKRVNSIPELKGYHPIIKGMVAIESGGNPNAYNKKSKAAGLMQLTPVAQAENSVIDPYDPAENIAGGANHFKNRIKEIDKAITKASASQGIPIKPDLRFSLLAFNGGQKYVLDGIKRGYTTYPEMVQYIKSVKSPEAAAENLAYPDKVLSATLQFMEGGNLADDNTMKQLIIAGIVDPFVLA